MQSKFPIVFLARHGETASDVQHVLASCRDEGSRLMPRLQLIFNKGALQWLHLFNH